MQSFKVTSLLFLLSLPRPFSSLPLSIVLSSSFPSSIFRIILALTPFVDPLWSRLGGIPPNDKSQ